MYNIPQAFFKQKHLASFKQILKIIYVLWKVKLRETSASVHVFAIL